MPHNCSKGDTKSVANMDESSGWLMDTLDIEVPNIPDQRASLPLMTLAVNSKVLIQNMNVGNQETASSISFNTLRPNYFGHKNHCEAAGASYGEHQPSRSGDAKPGPQLRKEHTKSRSGCYTCKKRRIKVHLTRQITRWKINMYHSVQKTILSALNAPDVASNVNGQSFTAAKQEKL